MKTEKSARRKAPRGLVTGGGTAEPIDEVRCLTNRSTGTLAAMITEELLARGWTVDHLCAESARVPEPPAESDALEIRPFSSFADLEAALFGHLEKRHYKAVVHAAAVSDFTVDGVASLAEVAEHLYADARDATSPAALAALLEAALAATARPRGGKLSSGELPLIVLKRTRKLLDGIRAATDAILVSFKLTAGASEEECIATARRQLERSASDLVFANDVGRFVGWKGQCGHLVSPIGDPIFAKGKAAIAKVIAKACDASITA